MLLYPDCLSTESTSRQAASASSLRLALFANVLRAEHRQFPGAGSLKPWRNATDAERLDGANGLLLSPHIDHLFDEGYITFSSNQELVMVPGVRPQLLD